MRGESVRARCPHRRIHDAGNCRKYWKRSRHKLTILVKPGPVEAFRAQLLASVKENATSAPYDSLPTRRVVEDIGNTKPWCKVVPRGLPERRALRCQRPRIRIRSLNCIGHQPLSNARRGIHLPAKPQRKAQPLQHFPIILGKCREVLVQRVGGSLGYRKCKWAVRLDAAFTKIKIIYFRIRRNCKRRQAAIVHAKFELMAP